MASIDFNSGDSVPSIQTDTRSASQVAAADGNDLWAEARATCRLLHPEVPCVPGAFAAVIPVIDLAYWERGNRPVVFRVLSIEAESFTEDFYMFSVRPWRFTEDISDLQDVLYHQGGPFAFNLGYDGKKTRHGMTCDLFGDGRIFVEFVTIYRYLPFSRPMAVINRDFNEVQASKRSEAEEAIIAALGGGAS